MRVVETSSETPQLPLKAFPITSKEPERPDYLRPLRFADCRIALTDRCIALTDRHIALADRRIAFKYCRIASTERRIASTEHRIASTERRVPVQQSLHWLTSISCVRPTGQPNYRADHY